MMISGIAACEVIDSSGEVLDIQGLDISSLERDGVFNYEHESKTASSIVGKILKAKKIFSGADCENDSQKKFWDKVKAPYVWVLGELFDDVGHTESMNIAAMLRYDLKAKAEGKYSGDMAQLVNLSVEGAKLHKEGNVVTKSIARKVSITITPCSKVASVDIHNEEPSEAKKVKKSKVPDLSIFKSETLALPEADVLEELNKADMPAKVPPIKAAPVSKQIGQTKSGKAIDSHSHTGYATGFDHQDHRDAMNAHWDAHMNSKDPTSSAHHRNMATKHLTMANAREPKAKNPISTVSAHASTVKPSTSKPYIDVPGKRTQDLRPGNNTQTPTPKAEVKKSMSLGSAAGVPGSLTGGAAVSKQDIAKMKKAEEIRALNNEIDKSLDTWEKVEHFRKWLGEKMPSLSKKEKEAFIKMFGLYRIKKAEKKLREI